MYMFVRILSLLALLTPLAATAQGVVPSRLVPVAGANGEYGFCELMQLGQNLLNFTIFIGVVACAFTFMYAGYLYMTAGVDGLGKGEAGIKLAKKMFKNVLIGIVVILGAWLIVDTLISSLTTTSLTGGLTCTIN
jgi:Type IV secretion system pilin